MYHVNCYVLYLQVDNSLIHDNYNPLFQVRGRGGWAGMKLRLPAFNKGTM